LCGRHASGYRSSSGCHRRPERIAPSSSSSSSPRICQVMTPTAWNYYSSGADDEVTMRDNHAAFQRIWFRPRILVNVKEIDLRTTIMGHPSSMPVCVAQPLAARDPFLPLQDVTCPCPPGSFLCVCVVFEQIEQPNSTVGRVTSRYRPCRCLSCQSHAFARTMKFHEAYGMWQGAVASHVPYSTWPRSLLYPR
jgi:hypothetical protein